MDAAQTALDKLEYSLLDGDADAPVEFTADEARAVVKALREVVPLRDLAIGQSREIENLRDMDDAVECLRQIGQVIGCDHVDDPDGRRQLVTCVEQVFQQLRERRS